MSFYGFVYFSDVISFSAQHRKDADHHVFPCSFLVDVLTLLCIQQLSTLRRTLPTRPAFVSPKCCRTLQCAHHFSRMRGRVHFGEFGPGIFSGPNLQSAPRFCKVRRQSLRVRGGFLQSAHFAEKRGAGFVKSRVFLFFSTTE